VVDVEPRQFQELVEVEQVVGVRTECVGRAGSSAEVPQEAAYFCDGPVVVIEEIKRDAPILLSSLNPHMPPPLLRTYVLDSVHDPGLGMSI